MFNDNNTNIVSAIASTTKTDYFKNKKKNSDYKKGKNFNSFYQDELTKIAFEEKNIINTVGKVDLNLQNTLVLSHSLMKTQRAFLYK